MNKIQEIQSLLGVEADGAFGPLSQAALDKLIYPEHAADAPALHRVKATSFADPADVRVFRDCKAAGHSDEHCFGVGDNGVGCFGDDCTGPELFIALPPEDLEETWGSVEAAKHQPVEVTANGITALAKIGDRMPHRRTITNGAGMDMSPSVCAALGLNPPVDTRATWRKI